MVFEFVKAAGPGPAVELLSTGAVMVMGSISSKGGEGGISDGGGFGLGGFESLLVERRSMFEKVVDLIGEGDDGWCGYCCWC